MKMTGDNDDVENEIKDKTPIRRKFDINYTKYIKVIQMIIPMTDYNISKQKWYKSKDKAVTDGYVKSLDVFELFSHFNGPIDNDAPCHYCCLPLWYVVTWINQSPPGPRLNIKTFLSMYGDFHVKDKTAVRTSYL